MKHSEKSTKYEHFNAVYAGSYAAVLRWISGRVPADLAEELTQQTFMQYWQWLLAAAAFPKSDKSLLLSIARSVCADHYRAIAARAVCVAIPEDFDLPDRADPITMVEWAQVLGMLGREDQILLAMRRRATAVKRSVWHWVFPALRCVPGCKRCASCCARCWRTDGCTGDRLMV